MFCTGSLNQNPFKESINTCQSVQRNRKFRGEKPTKGQEAKTLVCNHRIPFPAPKLRCKLCKCPRKVKHPHTLESGAHLTEEGFSEDLAD